MKISKILLSLAVALCVMLVPFAASAAETPVSVMPTADTDVTIIEGTGEITVADGVAILKNTGSGTLRVEMKSAAKFDLSKLHTLHMKFKAETPFKMAYHIGTASDNGWMNTSDNFANLFTIANDRAAAGEYDVNMASTGIINLTNTADVGFLKFIVLVDAGGSFTISAAEMTDGTNAVGGETTKADSQSTTETTVTTTVAKTTAKAGTDSAKTADTSSAVLFVIVAVAAAGVVTTSVVAKQKVR